MNDATPLDGTDAIAPAETEAQEVTDQEESQVPVSDDTAESAQPAEAEKSRAQHRIEGLVSDKKTALEDKANAIEYGNTYKQLYEDLKTQHTPATPAPVRSAMPTLEGCDYDDTVFAGQMATWNKEQIDLSVKQQVTAILSQNSATAAKNEVAAGFQAKAAKFTETNADFASVTQNPNLAITAEMGEVIATSDLGPELAYHLGKNPSEASKIAQLSPMRQAVALGRIEASLSAKPAAKTETTKAPPPMSTVGGQQPNVTPSDDESCEAYIHRRRAEKAEKRRARVKL